MLNLRVAGGVRFLADRFKDLLTGPSNYNALCCFLTLYLFDCSSMSELARITGWSQSVSSLSRSLVAFKGNRFMRRMRRSILRRYGNDLNPEDFCYVIDDTDNPKSSLRAYFSGRWKSSKGIYWGQRISLLALVDIKRGFAIPLSYRISRKTDETYKETGIDMAMDMAREILSEGFPTIPLVADSWFDATKLISGLTELEIPYYWELKANRCARLNAGRNVPWVKFAEIFSKSSERMAAKGLRFSGKRIKWISETVAQLKTYKTPIRMIAVYNQKNGREAFAYYGSTDRRASWQRMWELSRARWKIECLFRDLKQNLCFGRLATITECGTNLAVCIPLILITSLRLDSEEVWNVPNEMTIGQKLTMIREVEMNRSIALLTEQPDSKVVIKFRNRRARPRQKPVDQAAEVRSRQETRVA